MNKSFLISLFIFVLLMCSCKTHKFAHEINFGSREISEIAYLNNTVKIDTSKTTYSVKEIQNIVIEEDITETEYDKESGKPIKETKTKRKTTQDSDKVVSEESQKGMSEVRNDSLNQFRDVTKKIESEVEEETEGSQEAFGKWLGIMIGLLVSETIIYLLIRYRVD